MAKKIRFALVMDDGAEVRSVEELKEHFSLERAAAYISNGKMDTWLRDRYEDKMADALAELNSADENFEEKVCAVFGVDYDAGAKIDMESIAEHERRLALLKKYTSDKDILDNADSAAFTQEELFDLLDEECGRIYLCGERFEIPLSKSGVKYIGVNRPIAVIHSNELVDWEKAGIALENVAYDEKYRALEEERGEKSAKEAFCDGDEEDSGYYAGKADGSCTIYDKNDNPVVNLNDFAESVDIAPIVCGNYVYYIEDVECSEPEYHWEHYLHRCDILRREDHKYPQKLRRNQDSFGIAACSNKWLVYFAAAWKIFDLENDTVREAAGPYVPNEFYGAGERTHCALIGDFFYIMYPYELERINLKNLRKMTALESGNDINFEGRLMKVGDKLFCVTRKNDDIKLNQINGETGVLEKSLPILNKRNASVVDSLYYKKRVFYIISSPQAGHDGYWNGYDEFDLCCIDTENGEIKQLEHIGEWKYAHATTHRFEISENVLYYELHDIRNPLKSNNVVIE